MINESSQAEKIEKTTNSPNTQKDKGRGAKIVTTRYNSIHNLPSRIYRINLTIEKKKYPQEKKYGTSLSLYCLLHNTQLNRTETAWLVHSGGGSKLPLKRIFNGWMELISQCTQNYLLCAQSEILLHVVVVSNKIII